LQVHTHVPQDNPYSIPTDYDPNLALVLIWGKDIEEAKQRGECFLNELEIDGENSKGEKIVTNIEFLKEKVNQIQRFV